MKCHLFATRRPATILLLGPVRLLGWLLATFWLFSPQVTFGTDRSWSGSSNTTWNTGGNWVGGNAPSAGDNALFDSAFSNQPNLTGNTSVGGIWMKGSVGQDVTISGGAFTLTLNGNTINGTAGLGILIDSTDAYKLTINCGLKVGNNQSWTNNSSSLLTISGAVNVNNKILIIDGTGDTTISGVVSNTGVLSKAGTGTLTLSNTGDTYTALLAVQAGTLKIDTINNASANGELGNNALSVILGSAGGVTGTLEYTGGSAAAILANSAPQFAPKAKARWTVRSVPVKTCWPSPLGKY